MTNLSVLQQNQCLIDDTSETESTSGVKMNKLENEHVSHTHISILLVGL